MKHRRIALLLTLTLAILMALPMPALAAAKKDWHALNAKDQTAIMDTLQAQSQYAGCYWEEGTLHILSTRPAALRKTVQALGERYDLAIVVDQEAARYTYAQLTSGLEKLTAAMGKLDVWSVGLDERENRLELISEKTWSSARKREAAKAAGLPQGALRFLKERQPSLLDVVEVVDPPVNAPDNNTGGTRMAADRGLNVRSGPGTKYAIVGELDKGNVVTYLGKSGSWAKIRYAAGSTGYVYAAYLDPYTGSGSYETGTSFEGTHAATANVNVRSGPGTNYTRLGSIKKGELVTATGTSGSWTKIQWFDGVAYVSSAYLKAK